MPFQPIIGITMGDPASIGPEITLKVLGRREIYEKCRPIVVGDAGVLRKSLEIPGIPPAGIHAVGDISEARFEYGTVDVLDLGLIDTQKLKIGEVSAEAGNAAFRYVEKDIEMALAGEVDATVTNALNKEAMNLAGHRFAGHTEIYAQMTGTEKYAMMLAYENLRVVHVSTHVPLHRACELVRKGRVFDVIRMADQACRALSIEHPRVGVAGLNPHCGENGLFGREEMEEIGPAVELARERGICAEGPVPPDSVFPRARGGMYDIVVAMYHDQGHIPLKMLGFVYDREQKRWKSVEGVNITLGLPIIRTSVDHGTAFDQAGKGMASDRSLFNAILYAVGFAEHRKADPIV